ncbi:MAG: peptidoglycan bridge formation glycyltransferase FemA/FemB family protein [Patescibacteria group bacterium]
MELKEITASVLSLFINKLSPSSGLFLQTPSWCKLEQAEGYLTEILGFYDDANLVGSSLVVTRKMRGGFTYFYIPKGPVVVGPKYLAPILDLLLERYQSRGLFLRLEPPVGMYNNQQAIRGFIKTNSVQPPATLLLDLTRDTNELLANMHQKTRYNIHLAEKKGLIWQLRGKEGWEDFWRLLQKTAGRDRFKIHTKRHYEQLVAMFAPENLETSELAIRFAEVYQGDELLASSLLIFSGKVVTYLHGASANLGRELMPTYLLHWQTIQEAKKLGYKLYDWWGISTPLHQHLSWNGVTRFKLGFGGKQVDYCGTFDYPCQKIWYLFYKCSRYLLR